MNDDAELYNKSNSLQKRGAVQCLEEYASKIKWKNFDKVLDIGCGDGGVTTSILRRFIPDNFKKLVGCDISEKMVQYANKNHGDERISFRVLDIEGVVPEGLQRSFDHAFSFYSLHWISDQERAFSNIYRLLTDGGDCLLVFVGHMPIFDVFRILSRRARWRWWLRDVDRYVSPYHDSEDPEKEVRVMMAKQGFQNIAVECKEMSFVYDTLEICKKSVAAVNPFKIPADMQEEFLEDYLQVVNDMRLIDHVNNNVNIKANYSLLIAYGRK